MRGPEGQLGPEPCSRGSTSHTCPRPAWSTAWLSHRAQGFVLAESGPRSVTGSLGFWCCRRGPECAGRPAAALGEVGRSLFQPELSGSSGSAECRAPHPSCRSRFSFSCFQELSKPRNTEQLQDRIPPNSPLWVLVSTSAGKEAEAVARSHPHPSAGQQAAGPHSWRLTRCLDGRIVH